MSVRCKMQLQSQKTTKYSKEGTPIHELAFSCQYDTSIPEDQRFVKATPTGHFIVQVDNPAALAQLEVGGYYYFDITPVA